jgi:dipeptidase E
MGETREERLLQFLEENETPVIGLREGAMLNVRGENIFLNGINGARVFRRSREPEEYAPPAQLAF